MNAKLRPLAYAIAAVLGLLILRWYWRHEGAADAKLSQQDAAHVAHVDSLERWAKDRKRLEDSLRVRVADAESARVVAGRTVTRLLVRVDTLRASADTAALVAALDSVIFADSVEKRHIIEERDTWHRLFVSADSGRTAFHESLHEAEALRETWKHRAQRRLACVAGPSVTVGWNGRSAIGVGVSCGLRF